LSSDLARKQLINHNLAPATLTQNPTLRGSLLWKSEKINPRIIRSCLDKGLGALGVCMSSWKALYTAALAESDPNKLQGRIEAARKAIRDRLEDIEGGENDREREQLDQALHALFTLAARKRSA